MSKKEVNCVYLEKVETYNLLVTKQTSSNIKRHFRGKNETNTALKQNVSCSFQFPMILYTEFPYIPPTQSAQHENWSDWRKHHSHSEEKIRAHRRCKGRDHPDGISQLRFRFTWGGGHFLEKTSCF